MKPFNMMEAYGFNFVSDNPVTRKMGNWTEYVRPTSHLDIHISNTIYREVLNALYETETQ